MKFELKAAIQLIKGKHSTKDFKEISNEEYMEAAALCLISVKLNTNIVFRRGSILPCVGQDSEYSDVFFKMPLTESCKEWERAYEDLLR